MDNKILARAILAVWVFVWAIFTIRPFFKKDLIGEYRTLASLSLEGKRACTTGIELYDFIKFCNASIGRPVTYGIIGLNKEPLDGRRAAYYLYPNIEDKDSQFLLVYKVKGFRKENYDIFKTFDEEKYILKKAR